MSQVGRISDASMISLILKPLCLNGFRIKEIMSSLQ
jgi:hypothetical protein